MIIVSGMAMSRMIVPTDSGFSAMVPAPAAPMRLCASPVPMAHRPTARAAAAAIRPTAISRFFGSCAEIQEPPAITFQGASYSPIEKDLTVRLCPASFRRGDFNGDGGVDISDAIATLGHLFLDGPAPGCAEAADFNDDGGVDISDAIFLLQDLFAPSAGSAIPPPGPFYCGPNPGSHDIGCRSSPCP